MGPLELLFVRFLQLKHAKRAFSKKCSWCVWGHDFGGLGGLVGPLGSVFGGLGWLLAALGAVLGRYLVVLGGLGAS